MSIDSDKLITINDCRGTCKTPIGCTCGGNNKLSPHRQELDRAVLEEPRLQTAVDATICTCGKNTGAACMCQHSGILGGGSGCSKRGPAGGCCGGADKLEVYDWMAYMPEFLDDMQMVEVQFKNTRKEYYLNSNQLELKKGDMVAVESQPGHDIGTVVLTGRLVKFQMKKNNYRGETKRVYRIARSSDIEKYEECKAKEHKTMLRARILAEELELEMKISDVEYQGDGNKVIFYYIADGRVDFRQLIKVYASEFRVRIEMRQIGARQEAGRVGGIGSCGRELCCSGSMSNFVSVSTSAARLQDIPLNPQKLAGQCGKLKCCLNFEVDTYVEARKKMPPNDIELETKDITYHHFKSDVLSGLMTYSTEKHFPSNLVELDKARVSEIIRMNRMGDKPITLQDFDTVIVDSTTSGHDILDQDINRFDTDADKATTRKERARNNRRKPRQNTPNQEAGTNQQNQTQTQEQRGKRTQNRSSNKPKSAQNKETIQTNRGRANRPPQAQGAQGEANKQNKHVANKGTRRASSGSKRANKLDSNESNS